MDATRGVVVAVGALVVVTALVSGPLVPGLSLTNAQQPAYGEGTATVASVEFPERATIERGGFGSESDYLVVPPATVRFGTFDGAPVLTYKIEIPALNYSRGTTHFLSPDTGTRYEATLRSDSLAELPDERTAFDARLSVWIEDTDGRSRVATQNTTVEVVE
ncbi:hypothetical protein ACFQL1_03695 [Halomicroarcula sp. GCM10025709]|uniref:hypothetical protein n=1 Tax=Haloarcula TaxID=2237 RepID=UPI0024C223E7|nr:hypothetical protein [Halomicroarcula sp. YJ-61-S]